MNSRTPVQTAALLVGIVFALVGVLGFVPGITTSYGDLAFAGHGSGAMLLGVFQVSILHNIVHLLFGIAGIMAAKTAGGSRNFLIGGGVIYLLLAIYGALVGQDAGANFVPVNGADDVLHLVLGVAMIALGALLGKRTAGAASASGVGAAR